MAGWCWFVGTFWWILIISLGKDLFDNGERDLATWFWIMTINILTHLISRHLLPLSNNFLAHISDPNVKKMNKIIISGQSFLPGEALWWENHKNLSHSNLPLGCGHLQLSYPLVVPHAVSQKVGISEVRQRNLKSKKTFYKGDNPKTTNIFILKSHIANAFSCRGWMQHQRRHSMYLQWSCCSYRGQEGKSSRNVLFKECIVQGAYCSRDVLFKGRIAQGTFCSRDVLF